VKDKHFSVDCEPAISGGPGRLDPSEARAALPRRDPSELEILRDAVTDEPALPQYRDPELFARWLARRRSGSSLSGNLLVTVLVAVLAGPAAIIGALAAGHRGVFPLVYMVSLGPVVEEILKQSGMIYLLEKKPYRVFAAWQFPFAALVSGLVFSAIENLAYIHVYAPAGVVEDTARLAAFRWAVCTPLHVSCALIASWGLVRVWKKQLGDGRPADLSAGFGLFAVAVSIHGLYNFAAVLLDRLF